MISRVFIALTAIVFLANPGMTWAKDLYRVPLAAYNIPSITPDHKDLVNAYSRADEPDWMEAVVAQLVQVKSRNRKIKTRLLFKDEKGPSYLAVLWTSRVGVGDIFELYRTVPNPNEGATLQFMQHIKADHLEMVYPTGTNAIGDGMGTVYLQFKEKEGSSWTKRFGLRVVRLQGTGKEILRSARGLYPTNAGDFQGEHAVIAYQELKDPDMALTSKQSGTYYIPMMLNWKGRSYIKNCRGQNDYFRRYAERLKAGASKGSLHQRLDNIIFRALILAQGGAIKDAQGQFSSEWNRFIDTVKDNRQDFSYTNALLVGKHVISRLEHFSKRKAACPVF